MHDIKLIRKDPNLFNKKISDRNIKFDFKELLNLDLKNRELIKKKKLLNKKKRLFQLTKF